MPAAKPSSKSTIKAVSSPIKSTPKSVTKKPAVKPDDGVEKITVKVHKKSPPEAVKPKVEPISVSTPADDQELDALAKPDEMNPEQMEQWFDDLDTLEAPDEDAVKVTTSADAHIDLKAPIGSLITPEEEVAGIDPNADALKGFIADKTDSASHHVKAGTDAKAIREQMAHPMIFDTNIAHPAIAPRRPTPGSKQSHGLTWFFVVCVLLALVGVYAAIDRGWFGGGVNVPWHIFS